MPLLNRKPYEPGPRAPANLKPSDEVFVVRVTGEAVATYEEYLAKLNLYRQRSWVDAYSGKGGLTYEEALRHEEKAAEALATQLAKVPEAMQEAVVRQVHHSTLSLEALIGRVYDAHKPAPKNAGKENEPEDKSSGPHPLKSRALIRSFIVDVADKTHGVWVAKASWVQKYDLPQEMPEAARVVYEQALSAKKGSKATKSANGGASSSAAPSPSTAGRKRDSTGGRNRESTGQTGDNGAAGELPPRPPARTLAEEEERLKEGTLKWVLFQVLRKAAAGSQGTEDADEAGGSGTKEGDAGSPAKQQGHQQGMSVDEVIQAATAQGLKSDWTEKAHKNVASYLHRDATFCRVAKGRYTIRALPGVVPLDSAPRAAKAPKEGTDTNGSPAKGKEAADKDAAGPSEGQKKKKKKAAAAAEGEGADAAVKAPDGMREGSSAPPAAPLTQEQEDAAAVARAEAHVKQTKASVDRRARALQAAEASLATLKQELEAAQAVAREQRKAEREAERARRLSGQHSEQGTPAPGEGSGAGAAAAGEGGVDAELPAELQKYGGDEGDRKALMAWRKARAEAEKKLQLKRERLLQERRLSEVKQKAESNKAVTDLQAAIAKAQAACEVAAAQSAKAVKAAAEAERTLEREKQRGALRSAKENAKVEREKLKQADKEDRERRRQEALKAKRYPIDDTELMQELQEQAAANGVPPPPEELPQPQQWLDREQGRRLSDALYVADFLGQFGKALGVKGLPYQELEELLAALPVEQQTAAAAAAASGTTADAPPTVTPTKALTWLSSAYQGLLVACLLDREADGAVGRMERRWVAGARSFGAWPEVLRRYMAGRAEYTAELGRASCVVDTEAAAAAAVLAAGGPGVLGARQHLCVLRFLVDEVLETELLRARLADRMEGAADVAAEIRGEMAEERRKLREMAEAEKEGRKRKRAQALALATAAAERQLAEQGAAAAGDAPNGDAPGPEAKKARLASKMLANLLKDGGAGDGGDSSDEEEPSWELPAELQEYTGDTGDRKAVTAWRQQQQAARQKLEKDKARWEAGKRKRQKDREARRKAEGEEDKKKARERAAAEEALAERQEALDRELERFIIRRAPLGLDRSHRAYWWGLAGHKSALLVTRQGEGHSHAEWGLVEEADELEALLEGLDVRGLRERDLKAALEKAHASIQTAMRKTAAARAPPTDDADASAHEEPAGPSSKAAKRAIKLKGIPPERVLPSRHARAVAQEGIKATSTTGAAAAAAAARQKELQEEAEQEDVEMEEAADAGVLQGWEGQALEGACHDIAALATAASAAKLQGPAGGWVAWRRKLMKLLAGDVDEAWAEDAAAATGGAKAGAVQAASEEAAVVLQQLRARLLEAEGWLFNGCADAKYNRGRKGAGEEGEEQQEGEEEESEEEEEGEAESDQEEDAAQPMEVDAPPAANGTKRGRAGKQAQPAPAPAPPAPAPAAEPANERRGRGRPRKVAPPEESKEEKEEEENGGADGEGGEGSGEEAAGSDEQERGGSQRAHGRRLSMGHHHVARLLQKPGEPDEEVWSEDECGLKESARKRCIWRKAAERTSWRACTAAASTPALLAYCAAALRHHGEGPLEVMLGKGKSQKRKKGRA